MRHLVMFFTMVFVLAYGAIAQDDAPAKAGGSEPIGGEESHAIDSPLVELSWMVGTWVDQQEESEIYTKCAWTKNEKFLTRSFRVTRGDEVLLEGTQVVGWDPADKQIRSWTFDSEGGFGEGRWIRDANQWLVKTSFVLATGERASAVNVITYVDNDTFLWQSVDREVGGKLLPMIPQVTIVRQRDDATGAGKPDR